VIIVNVSDDDIASLKRRNCELLEQQQESEAAFAQQRAKFMELFRQKEGHKTMQSSGYDCEICLVMFMFSFSMWGCGCSMIDGKAVLLVFDSPKFTFPHHIYNSP